MEIHVYECLAEIKKGLCSHWANEYLRKDLNKAQSTEKEKEFPRFLRDLKAHHRVQNSPPVDSILIQCYEIHTLTSS
jgi:hypothetical protein